jgi:chemotaxis signal transduction protein
VSEKKQFCTFFLGPRMFGVEVVKIQEVLRYQEMTEVPLAPPVIRGLLNLRGSIVATLDLRRRFGMPAAEDGVLPTNVVSQTSTGLISLLVDRIGDVVEVDQESFEPSPETLDGEGRSLIDGVYKLASGLLMILNVERALELEPARNV